MGISGHVGLDGSTVAVGKSRSAWRYVFHSSSFDNTTSLPCVQSVSSSRLFRSSLRNLVGSSARALFMAASNVSLSGFSYPSSNVNVS
jgi:hypothetical protein